MNIVVTGADGFVGEYVTNYLETQEPSWDVYAATRKDFENGFVDVPQPDVIINFASASSVEQSFKNPSEFIEDNVQCMLRVLNLAANGLHRPYLLLHFSTIEVYNPTNPYAASKAAQETIAKVWANIYEVPLVIARSSNIVGDGQSPEKFVPKTINAIRERHVVDIYKNKGRAGTRVYIPIRNIASAVHFLARRAIDGDINLPPTRAYDIDGGEALTNLEMASRIAALLQRKLHYEYVEPGRARPSYTTELEAKGKPLTSIGWKPPQTLQQGMLWIR